MKLSGKQNSFYPSVIGGESTIKNRRNFTVQEGKKGLEGYCNKQSSFFENIFFSSCLLPKFYKPNECCSGYINTP